MSLLEYMGAPLAAEVWELLICCRAHGHQPAVLACPCVLEGHGVAMTGMDGVFCAAHVRGFNESDPAADEDLERTCYQCLVNRGLLHTVVAA